MSVSKEFVMGGNATFTVQFPESKERQAGHYTYKVRHKEASGNFREAWFVSLLTGHSNETDFSYLGMLDTFTGQVRTTAKSCQGAESFPVRLLNKILTRVWGNDHAAYLQFGFDIRHEGKCGRCGRKLTTPESLDLGIGPECADIMGLPYGGKEASVPVAGGMVPAQYEVAR